MVLIFRTSICKIFTMFMVVFDQEPFFNSEFFQTYGSGDERIHLSNIGHSEAANMTR